MRPRTTEPRPTAPTAYAPEQSIAAQTISAPVSRTSHTAACSGSTGVCRGGLRRNGAGRDRERRCEMVFGTYEVLAICLGRTAVEHSLAHVLAEHGAAADAAWLRSDLEQAIRGAPRDPARHDDSYIEFRVADLDSVIGWILDREREKGGGQSAETCEPTYPAPLGSVAEARRVLADAMDRFAAVALAWRPPELADDDGTPWIRPGASI